MWEKANSIGVLSAGENQIPGGTRSTDYPIELVVIHQSPVGPPPLPPTQKLKKATEQSFIFQRKYKYSPRAKRKIEKISKFSLVMLLIPLGMTLICWLHSDKLSKYSLVKESLKCCSRNDVLLSSLERVRSGFEEIGVAKKKNIFMSNVHLDPFIYHCLTTPINLSFSRTNQQVPIW